MRQAQPRGQRAKSTPDHLCGDSSGTVRTCFAVTTGARPRDRREEHVTTTALATPLSAADRCDRCGARAYIRVSLTSGGELLFCAHHGREHADRLREVATDIHDETTRLVSHES